MANLQTQGTKKQQSLRSMILSAIKIARPVHWLKNFALFAALVFTGNLFVKALFIQVVWAFIAFSLASSAAYIINDILDAKRDRLHPIKKFRPVASGKLPVPFALAQAVFLSFLALFLSSQLNEFFFLMILGYLLLQVLYSLALKNLIILDILIIATGFIIRVYAGALVIDAHLSVWFLLCVISVALFLASGKRRAELNLLIEEVESKVKQNATRVSLTQYKRELLNSYVTMFGNAAWMSWSLFTFFESPRATLPVWLFLAELSRATTINKLLMITIPITIFGIMRYQSLIFEGKTEAPEKLLLTDRALVFSVLLWVGVVIWIYYGGITQQLALH